MRIDLMKLKLTNFKGVKSFELNLDGSDADVYGENGAGKTTLFDAFQWLLFDKDSDGATAFSIKTLDKGNEVVHGLDHEVEGVFLLDGGRELKLRKLHREKWVKKHGGSESIYSGNETLCWVDDVPVKKGEYDDRIGWLMEEGLFRMLTNPEHFSAGINWQKRREILLGIAGDVADAEVAASDKKLKGLAALLESKSIDELTKMNNEKIKRYKAELEDIRPRVDERMSQMLPEEETAKKAEIEGQIKALEEERGKLAQTLASGTAQSHEVKRIGRLIAGLEAQQDERRRELESAAREEHYNKLRGWQDAQRELETARSDLALLSSSRDNLAAECANIAERLKKARDEYTRVYGMEFEAPELDENCQLCGQRLPDSKIEGQLEDIRNKFAEDKKALLEEVTCKGTALKSEKDAAMPRLETLAKEIAALASKTEGLEKTMPPELEPYEAPDLSGDEKIAGFERMIAVQQRLLENAKSADAAVDNTALAEQQKVCNEAIAALQSKLALIKASEESAARVEELKADERRISDEIAALEGIKHQCELFIVAKVRMLDKKINGMFKHVTFKMFATQVNGGGAECCEALVNGVPYKDANFASKVNAGLDIINTLSAHYKAYAPIFIDRAESVNRPIDTTAQKVRLVVSKDKDLKVKLIKKDELKEAV